MFNLLKSKARTALVKKVPLVNAKVFLDTSQAKLSLLCPIPFLSQQDSWRSTSSLAYPQPVGTALLLAIQSAIWNLKGDENYLLII